MTKRKAKAEHLTVYEVAEALRVSTSSVWRLLRRGQLESVKQSGRRLVPRSALGARVRSTQRQAIAPITKSHAMWHLVGAFRSGGGAPDSNNKYSVLFK